MAEAAELLSQKNEVLAIDINMGCSAPDIVNKGNGSKLLLPENFKNTELIIKNCRKRVKKCSLSVKIRSGYEYYDRDYLAKFCKMAEYEGVDYIIIHPRTGRQAFKRVSDWKVIEDMKTEIGIPIIGNGDINSVHKARKIINNKVVEGIMIARLAISQPWIFSVIENKNIVKIDICEVAIDIIDGIMEYLPDELHLSRSRRYCSYFCKNIKFGHKLFVKLKNVKKIPQMKEIILEYFENNKNEKMKFYEAAIT
jgi:tRNA-dihydrouridine synthase